MDVKYPKIKKQDGTLEVFDPKKLEASLRRAGADSSVCKSIVAHIEAEVSEGDSTSVIYRHAFSLLKKKREQLPAARYSMKRAVQELGPSGFPFEKFVAEIFKAQGYQTKTGVVMYGKCAEHEVDLLAEKGNKRIGAEMKFHNNLGIKSDLKVALYVDARFEDLKPQKISEGWLITNTRFSSGAIKYGVCKNIKMISWNYPSRGSLQDLIEKVGVQPVTALTTLSKSEKKNLLDAGLVLCRMLCNEPERLKPIVSKHRYEKILRESALLCGNSKKV